MEDLEGAGKSGLEENRWARKLWWFLEEGRDGVGCIAALVTVSGSYFVLQFNNKHKKKSLSTRSSFLKAIHQNEGSWEERVKEYWVDTKVVIERC